MTLPLLDLLALALLLGMLPLASVVQLRFVEGIEIQKVPAYVSSMVTLMILGVGAWLVGTRGGDAATLGLGPAPLGDVAAWAGGIVLGGLILVVAFREGAVRLGLDETPLLRALMPRTAGERGLFVLVSLAAGVGEEIAYRGYALTTLATVVGPLWAAVVTSVVFGVLHAYQGWLGTVRTAALGGLLAWGYLASGSLWVPIAAHVALDLILGIALADRLMVPEARRGVLVPSDQGEGSSREEHGSGPGAPR